MLGILGGTFDPIHLGHIRMAEIALEELNLNKLYMLPSGDPPHKIKESSATHRYNMTVLACKKNERLFVSKLEIDRKGISYTLDTLVEIKKLFPKEPIMLIVGSDSLHSFPSWHEPKKIAALCSMAVVLRNEESSDLQPVLENLKENFNLKAQVFKQKGLNISSTQIRKLIHQSKDISPFLPKEVYQYIQENRLYRINQ
ncbi:MAG: nicotinate (nicotinamide) nucleotide adenylyltransferase [Eubacteriales bacterium]|nr:nicotinate (nicotinamide) nucleotide adenylyltransferase [Eubacteriales bacterium]